MLCFEQCFSRFNWSRWLRLLSGFSFHDFSSGFTYCTGFSFNCYFSFSGLLHLLRAWLAEVEATALRDRVERLKCDELLSALLVAMRPGDADLRHPGLGTSPPLLPLDVAVAPTSGLRPCVGLCSFGSCFSAVLTFTTSLVRYIGF